MSVLALIPARSGSKGIVGKNWRALGGKPLVVHAMDCAMDARIDAYVSTDNSARIRNLTWLGMDQYDTGPTVTRAVIDRPSELAQDDTPMIDVVKHALSEIPGEPDQIIVLLQPTQPFRTPAHITVAIALLQESGADSVVSVVTLPQTHSPDMLFGFSPRDARFGWWLHVYEQPNYWEPVTRRQDARPAYMRDGTVYAFRRATVEKYGAIYGRDVLPLIIPPDESCELDTEADWAEVVRRWEARAVGVK